MNIIRSLIAPAIIAASLFGCSTPPPISGSVGQNISADIGGLGGSTDLVTTGIANAQYNLHSAVTVGALSATDPAPACLDQAAALLGLSGTPAASFVPKISDAISAGSVGYIYLQQLKTITGGGITLPPACLQILGQLVLDVQQGVNKAAVSALLPGLGSGIGLALPNIGLAPVPNRSMGGK